MNSTVVYLPFSTAVNVRVFSNAYYNQRVTLTPESGNPTVYTGAGEHDHPLGNTIINTPASGASPRGYQVKVTVDTYYNGSWHPSSVAQGACGIMYYNMTLVISEDYVDQDWNDSGVTFTWWLPPSTRSLDDFQITPRTSAKGPA
jgi:hypothetical protein